MSKTLREHLKTHLTKTAEHHVAAGGHYADLGDAFEELGDTHAAVAKACRAMGKSHAAHAEHCIGMADTISKMSDAEFSKESGIVDPRGVYVRQRDDGVHGAIPDNPNVTVERRLVSRPGAPAENEVDLSKNPHAHLLQRAAAPE